jgi:hypothetical protein
VLAMFALWTVAYRTFVVSSLFDHLSLWLVAV